MSQCQVTGHAFQTLSEIAIENGFREEAAMESTRFWKAQNWEVADEWAGRNRRKEYRNLLKISEFCKNRWGNKKTLFPIYWILRRVICGQGLRWLRESPERQCSKAQPGLRLFLAIPLVPHCSDSNLAIDSVHCVSRFNEQASQLRKNNLLLQSQLDSINTPPKAWTRR